MKKEPKKEKKEREIEEQETIITEVIEILLPSGLKIYLQSAVFNALQLSNIAVELSEVLINPSNKSKDYVR